MSKVRRWNYGGNPADSSRDAVRFLVGDTNSNDPLLDDLEVDYLLSVEGSVHKAAIAACYGIAAMLARDFEGNLASCRPSEKPGQAYLELAKRLEAQAASKRTVVPFVGGISDADKQARAADADQVRPAFLRDMHRNIGAETGRDEPCR